MVWILNIQQVHNVVDIVQLHVPVYEFFLIMKKEIPEAKKNKHYKKWQHQTIKHTGILKI